MLRFTSMAILGLALAAPLAASANDLDVQSSDSTVVAANEDVYPRATANPTNAPSEDVQPAKPTQRKNRAHGSNQSAAEFRFQNPYAFPVQTLPMALPTVTNYSF